MVPGRFIWIKVALSFILSTFSLVASAQCTINAPNFTCVKDLVGLSVNASKTITAASWDFGDKSTSIDITPSHTYLAAGDDTIKVTVTFSDGTTCSASKPITVYPLPVIDFTVDQSSSYFCFTGNEVCVIDKTTSGGSNTKYTSRDILSGDGGRDTTSPSGNSNGDKICFKYKQWGKLPITLEARNDKGCKSKKEIEIEIFHDFPGVFNSWQINKKCSWQENDFMIDTSWLKYSNEILYAIYDYGDGTRDTLDTISTVTNRHRFTISKIHPVNLILQFKNGCETRYTKNLNINLDSIDVKIKKFDSILCYPNYFEFVHENISGADYSWTTYDTAGKAVENFGGARNAFFFPPIPGSYAVELRIRRGSCESFGYDTIQSVGVKARAKLLNASQCGGRDTVYFCDNSITHQSGPLVYLWNFGDIYSPQCTTDTEHGLNVDQNCNFSRDQHAKHFYDTTFCDQTWFTAMDTTNGCKDSMPSYVLIKKPKREDFRVQYARPCLRTSIDFKISDCFGSETVRVNYDSLCGKDSFEDYRPAFGYEKTCDSNGWVTVGFAIKTGDSRVYRSCDSNDFFIDPGRVCLDTFWFHNALHLNPVPRAQTSTRWIGCLPSTLKGSFLTKRQELVDKIYWYWGDGNADTTILHPDSLDLPDFEYTFNRSGEYEGFITLVSDSGCTSTSVFRRKIGFYNSFTFDKPICPGQPVQFWDTITYWDDTTQYWRHVPPEFPIPGLEKVYWDFDDGNGFSVSGPYPKHAFDTAGTYHVRMRPVDATGCADTTVMVIEVKDIQAGIKEVTKKLLCDDIIQLFDSSFLEDSVFDMIDFHYWDFGDGKAPSYLEDPFHNYSTYGEFTIQHVVGSKGGCTDTTYTKILIEGPLPHFDILSDTVACAPHTVEFKNNTQLASDYIWFFGDTSSSRNTYSTQSDTNVTFTYNKPGIYYIYLFAGDSVVNPDNGNQTYYCNSIFPDTNSNFIEKRRVVILPIPQVDFDAEGVLCTDRVLTLTDKSDPIYTLYRWFWNNDSSVTQDSSVQIILDQPGKMTIDYRPTYTPVGPYQKECFDSVSKEIEVFSNDNDFSFVKDSICPTFYFSADVGPGDEFMWDFGHPSSGPDNISFQKNETHSFAPDNGTFEVCLISKTTDGCEDTVCQMVESVHEFTLFVPNVMTPNEDNLNDLFEIEIDGEDLYELSIFNRWGERVYEADQDYPNGSPFNWDGTDMTNSNPCPPGTYFYIFKYREGCVDGAKTEKMQGTITLIRDNK